MAFKHLLDLSYWFAIFTPPFRKTAFIIAVMIFALCFIAGIVLRIVPRRRQMPPPLVKILARVSRPFFFFSILGAFLAWFRQVGAAILSARAALLLIFLIAAVWLGLILRGSFKRYRSELAVLEQQRAYKSYLPKRK